MPPKRDVRRKVADHGLCLIQCPKARLRSARKRRMGLQGKAVQLAGMCGVKVLCVVQADNELSFFCNEGGGTDWFRTAREMQEFAQQPGVHIQGFFLRDYERVFDKGGKWRGTEGLPSDTIVSEELGSSKGFYDELARQTGTAVSRDHLDISVSGGAFDLVVVPTGTPPPPPSPKLPEPKPPASDEVRRNRCLARLWAHARPVPERAPPGYRIYKRTREQLWASARRASRPACTPTPPWPTARCDTAAAVASAIGALTTSDTTSTRYGAPGVEDMIRYLSGR